MLERLRALGKYRPEFFKVYHKEWFDLYQYLGDNCRNLEHWCAQAKIKKKYPDLKGRDMPMFFEKRGYQKIVNHNLDDLGTSDKLFRFLRHKNPELILSSKAKKCTHPCVSVKACSCFLNIFAF